MRRFIAPFFEPTASGAPPVRVRGGNIIIEDAYLSTSAIEALLLQSSASGLALPWTLTLGHVAHAQISIPWSLSGPIELDIVRPHRVQSQPRADSRVSSEQPAFGSRLLRAGRYLPARSTSTH